MNTSIYNPPCICGHNKYAHKIEDIAEEEVPVWCGQCDCDDYKVKLPEPTRRGIGRCGQCQGGKHSQCSGDFTAPCTCVKCAEIPWGTKDDDPEPAYLYEEPGELHTIEVKAPIGALRLWAEIEGGYLAEPARAKLAEIEPEATPKYVASDDELYSNVIGEGFVASFDKKKYDDAKERAEWLAELLNAEETEEDDSDNCISCNETDAFCMEGISYGNGACCSFCRINVAHGPRQR